MGGKNGEKKALRQKETNKAMTLAFVFNEACRSLCFDCHCVIGIHHFESS